MPAAGSRTTPKQKRIVALAAVDLVVLVGMIFLLIFRGFTYIPVAEDPRPIQAPSILEELRFTEDGMLLVVGHENPCLVIKKLRPYASSTLEEQRYDLRLLGHDDLQIVRASLTANRRTPQCNSVDEVPDYPPRAVSPDGRFLAIAPRGVLLTYPVFEDTSQEPWEYESGLPVDRLGFRSESVLVAATLNGKLFSWAFDTKSVSAYLTVGPGELQVSGDFVLVENHEASETGHARIHLVDYSGDVPSQRNMPLLSKPRCSAVSRQGRVAIGSTEHLVVLSPEGEREKYLPFEGVPRKLEYSTGRDELAASTDEGVFLLRDAGTLERVEGLKGGPRLLAYENGILAYAFDSEAAYCRVRDDRRLTGHGKFAVGAIFAAALTLIAAAIKFYFEGRNPGTPPQETTAP